MSKPEGKSTTEDIRRLVIERVKASPKELRLSIGDMEYSTEEVLKHVEKGDEVGKQVMDAQINFLRDVARGKVYEDNEKETSNNQTKV